MTDLYLYQTIHIAQGRARNVAAHIALLDAASRNLFGRPYAPAEAELSARIGQTASAEGYPRTVSGFVRLELRPDGEDRLTPAGISLYDGYALRSLMPDAATVCYDLPLTDAPTTLREAATRLADLNATRHGFRQSVQCDADGVLLSSEGAPLFALRGRTVMAAPSAPSVEGALLRRAARRAGLDLVDEPFRRCDLRRLDELFYVDHRGVTALSHCDGVPFMSLLAERLAGALEGLFRKG